MGDRLLPGSLQQLLHVHEPVAMLVYSKYSPSGNCKCTSIHSTSHGEKMPLLEDLPCVHLKDFLCERNSHIRCMPVDIRGGPQREERGAAG